MNAALVRARYRAPQSITDIGLCRQFGTSCGICPHLVLDENVFGLHTGQRGVIHIGGEHSRVPVGRFKIGASQGASTALTSDVLNTITIRNTPEGGMVAFAGYPLIIEDRLVGVGMLPRNNSPKLRLTHRHR